MNESPTEATCANCGNSELTVPVLQARYAGRQFWICANCMPVLIHKTEQRVIALRSAPASPPELR